MSLIRHATLRIFFFSIIVCLCACKQDSNEDSRVKWLEKNLIRVSSIDPDDEDFSDLQPLKRIIGDSVKIVMLGEESHGDGSTFLAKTRLIKFFHKEMGFDVFAIESGMYSCRKTWQLVQSGSNYKNVINQSVFPIWTWSKEFQPLIEYLQSTLSTERPLEFAGFDCQLTGNFSKVDLKWDLGHFMKKYKINFVESTDWYNYKSFLQTISYGQKLNEPEKYDFDLFTDKLYDDFSLIHSDSNKDEIEFWKQFLLSTKAQAEVDFKRTENFTPDFYLRDIQMGKNLLWLSNVCYPNKKIIVWAANFHIVKNPFTMEGRDSVATNKNSITMGHVVWEELKNKVYIIGFTAYEGKYGSVLMDSAKTLSVERSSLEDFMHSANLEYSMLDFTHLDEVGLWLKNKFICYILGYYPTKADWTNVLDGLFYIREMKPSTHLLRK